MQSQSFFQVVACLQTEETEQSRGGPLQDQIRDLLEEEVGATGTKRQASLGGGAC